MIYGSVYESYGSDLGDVEAFAFDESLTLQEMGAQMLEEAAEDWNTYMKAIALTELSYVMETGMEYIYEGVDIKAMADKVKEWFKKLWAKIQGIVKSALAKFNQFAMSDQKFLDKYEKAIYDGERKIPTGFSYKGYTFKNLSSKASTITKEGGLVEKYEERVGNVNDNDVTYKTSNDGVKNSTKFFDTALQEYRGRLVGKGKLSDSEFTKAVKIDLYGSADKEYIKTVSASELIGIIKNAQDAKDNAKEAESDIKEFIDDAISRVDDAEAKLRDKASESKPDESEKRAGITNAASAFNNYSKYLKDVGAVNAKWFSMYMNAIKDQNRQAKAVCVKLVQFANGVGAKKESAQYGSGSLLEDRFAALDF